MSTLTVTKSSSRSLKPLVVLEIRRFVRNPAFLFGLVACVVFTAMLVPTASSDVNSGFLAAVCIGVVSMMVTYFQMRSTRPSGEALDSTPTSVTHRTAAMCIVCLVPAAFGAIWLASFYVTGRIWPLEPWMHGTFGPADEFAILLGQSVIACLGGPLAGVAAARWLRFRGAALILLVGTVGVVVLGLLEGWRTGSWNLRMLTPFTFFTDRRINPDAEDSLPGSPWWYLCWLLTLCALGVIAALLRDAEPEVARLLKLAGGVGLVVALTCGVLALTGGLEQTVRTYPDGRTAVVPVGS